MGKILDFIMCDGDWEKMQRIQLYKKVGNKVNELNLDKLENEIRH